VLGVGGHGGSLAVIAFLTLLGSARRNH
jgi:hypothetical protein